MEPTEQPIGPETSWIDAVMAREDLFSRLVTLQPKSAKFARVLNDERVAAALNMADVARILGLPLDTLLAVADGSPLEMCEIAPPAEPPAGWLTPSAREHVLDLRPVFERGQEPLAMILDEVATLPRDTDLVVVAPFHPLPLRRMLGGRGFDSNVRQVAADHWRVTFRQPWRPCELQHR